MKTLIHNFSIAIIPLIALSLVAFTTVAPKRTARHQASAIVQSESALQVPASSYSEVLNGLFAVSGR